MKEKQMNRCLNFIKAICCIGVVYTHLPFPNKLGMVISYFVKFAVPVFFMISGYFSYYDDKNERCKRIPKKIIHILKLLVVSELIYGIVYFINNKNLLNLNFGEVIFKLFIGSFFNGTLWFLYALIWGYVMLYLIYKTGKEKIFCYLAPIVLVLHVIIRFLIKNQEFYNYAYFRNFLVFGLPFILMGVFIRQNNEKIKNMFSNKICILGIIIGEAIMVVEWLITKTALDIYIGTIIYSFFIFVFAVKNPNKYINEKIEFIGKNLSMYVYIIHVLAIDFSVTYICKSDIMKYFTPVVSIIISIVMSYFIYFVINKIGDFKKIKLKF